MMVASQPEFCLVTPYLPSVQRVAPGRTATCCIFLGTFWKLSVQFKKIIAILLGLAFYLTTEVQSQDHTYVAC